MEREKDNWLEKYAVTCRVFKGRWSIRHCLKIYSEIKDLKIEIATRSRGGVQKYQSTYNPCEHCRVLVRTLRAFQGKTDMHTVPLEDQNQVEPWAACG